MNDTKMVDSLFFPVSSVILSIVLVLPFTNSIADENQKNRGLHHQDAQIMDSVSIHETHKNSITDNSEVQSNTLIPDLTGYSDTASLVVLGVVLSDDNTKSYAWISHNDSEPKTYNVGQLLSYNPEISVNKILIDRVVLEYDQKLVEKKVASKFISNQIVTFQNKLNEEEEEDSIGNESNSLVLTAKTQYSDDYSGEEAEMQISVSTQETTVHQVTQHRDQYITTLYSGEETEE